MNRPNRFFTLCLLSAALAAPAGVVLRAATPQDAKADKDQVKADKEQAKADKEQAKADHRVRVWDAKHNVYVYHDWTAAEDTAYRQFFEDRHEQFRAYDQQNADQQAAYWEWRANHPDAP
jgi:hypothetical protein